jgi:hypothetical protein
MHLYNPILDKVYNIFIPSFVSYKGLRPSICLYIISKMTTNYNHPQAPKKQFKKSSNLHILINYKVQPKKKKLQNFLCSSWST